MGLTGEGKQNATSQGLPPKDFRCAVRPRSAKRGVPSPALRSARLELQKMSQPENRRNRHDVNEPPERLVYLDVAYIHHLSPEYIAERVNASESHEVRRPKTEPRVAEGLGPVHDAHVAPGRVNLQVEDRVAERELSPQQEDVGPDRGDDQREMSHRDRADDTGKPVQQVRGVESGPEAKEGRREQRRNKTHVKGHRPEKLLCRRMDEIVEHHPAE